MVYDGWTQVNINPDYAPDTMEAKVQTQVFIEEYLEIYPALVEGVEKDFDDCIVYMSYSPER